MPGELESLQDGKVIVVRLSGTLSAEDYARFTPSVEAAVQQHGTIRIVVAMSDFHGWKMAALWEDVKFEAKHFHHIERLAMVGDRAWERGMAAFCMPFTTADKPARADVGAAESFENIVAANNAAVVFEILQRGRRVYTGAGFMNDAAGCDAHVIS